MVTGSRPRARRNQETPPCGSDSGHHTPRGALGREFNLAGEGSRGAGQGRTPRQRSCCCSYCPRFLQSPRDSPSAEILSEPLRHTSLHPTSLRSSVLADPLLIPSISYTRFVGGIQTLTVSHASEHMHTVLNRRTFTNDALWAGALHSRHVIYNMGVCHSVGGPGQEPDLIPRASPHTCPPAKAAPPGLCGWVREIPHPSSL